METARRAAEAACRAALTGRPALRSHFDRLLALAQRYAVLREEQASWFTLGWPFLRRAVLRLGEELRRRGAIAQVEDVFFLTRQEVEARLGAARQGGSVRQKGSRERTRDADLRAAVIARRQAWEHQRRLSPPLVLGNPLGARLITRATDAMRVPAQEAITPATSVEVKAEALEILTGMPASPGRATGPVRVIRGSEDFARFQPGEVLVAQVTAPAWTPLFGRAAAVVTDGGSLAGVASVGLGARVLSLRALAEEVRQSDGGQDADDQDDDEELDQSEAGLLGLDTGAELPQHCVASLKGVWVIRQATTNAAESGLSRANRPAPTVLEPFRRG